MLLRFFALTAIAIGILFSGSPALAKWHKAESERFVIYSDSRAEDLKDFGEKLERFHAAITLETGRTVPVPSPSNRLTIFMVGSTANLRDIYGNKNSSVGGFYIARATGSVSFSPNIRIRSGETDFALTVLLHEYTHHFLIGSARHAMPRWLSEGAAEYFASAKFHNDGSVDIGLPNNDRAYEISQAAQVTLIELLDYEQYRKNRGSRYDAFYGRSWLLYHYLRFEPSRKGQLVAYWQRVAGGMESLEAAQQVFGDLDKLDNEVKKYGKRRSMSGMRFAASEISIGAVTVSKLSKGHGEMMDVIIRSKRGVDDEKAETLARKARLIAAKYPNDPAVLEALAEAEYDAGNDDAAIAAADRSIAADQRSKNAYVQKGFALFRKAKDADDKDAAYSAAMQPFEALNALEADHTQPLIYYYRSFTHRGIAPPEGAKAALERATQLAPFDKDLAIEVAAMFALGGDPVLASYLLGPVAADPHGRKKARLAQAMIDFLKGKPAGRPVDFYSVMERLGTETSNADEDTNAANKEAGKGLSDVAP